MQPIASESLQAASPPPGLAALLGRATLELPPGSDPERLAEAGFARGGDVYVAFLPGGEVARSVATAAAVRRAGFRPVPHVAAREMRSRAALDDYLARLAGEAGVSRVLVIGGDSSVAHGAFHTCLDLLESGLLSQRGVTHVDFAGYPEGSYYLTFEQGVDLLAVKLAAARRLGLAPGIVTQFCMEADPIVAWLRAVAARDLAASIRIGLAGPATLPTLVKFALRCGVGNSLRALKPRIGHFGRLLNAVGPDAVVDGLGAALSQAEVERIDGLHFFAFGGARRVSDWVAARRCGSDYAGN
jgi:methylenetetrahydrofolate reductase (NADPH)